MGSKDPTFEDFRRLAVDPSLSPHEKTGFGDAYRKGKEELIFRDIVGALRNLDGQSKTIIEIGPGCTDLPRLLIEFCAEHRHQLVLVDCPEMLALLPEGPHVRKIEAEFPAEEVCEDYGGKADVVLAYSMIHTLRRGACRFNFVDHALALLAPGGECMIGDIPNVSKRRRFFNSDAGRAFHKQFMRTDEEPDVPFNRLEMDEIDDGMIFGLMLRARGSGFDSYIRQQAPELPFANRREDLIIVRP